MIIVKEVAIPYKVRSHDRKRKKRLSKMSEVLPANLKRARKYRSSGLWQKVRNGYIRNNPLCEDIFGVHEREGGPVGAKEVNHIEMLSSHFHLKAVESNLSALCTACHHKVSMMERKGKQTKYLFKRPFDGSH